MADFNINSNNGPSQDEFNRLDIHVVKCEARYQQLNSKINNVSEDVKEIKDSMNELKVSVQSHITGMNSKIFRVGGWLISGLLVIIGFLIIHLLF